MSLCEKSFSRREEDGAEREAAENRVRPFRRSVAPQVRAAGVDPDGPAAAYDDDVLVGADGVSGHSTKQ